MIEIVRYTIEQVSVFDEKECLQLIGKYADRMRGITD